MRFLVLCISGFVMFALSSTSAEAEQAGAYVASSSIDFVGLKGHQDIRTGPPTVVGVGYIHPVQMDIGDPGGGFVAIGTARGVGVRDCADHYTAGWTVYTDGQIGGVYFCHDEDVGAYNAGDSPFFKIVYGSCPSTGNNAWLMRFGDTIYRCISSDQHHGSSVNVLIETTKAGGTTVDRNIDAKYTGLQQESTGGYVDWGSAVKVVDPNYTVTQPDGASINAYLAPLD